MTTYNLKTEWQQTDTGRVYVVTIMTDTGLVLGVVRFDVPVMTGVDLSTVYGSTVIEEIIVQAAEEYAHRFARMAITLWRRR